MFFTTSQPYGQIERGGLTMSLVGTNFEAIGKVNGTVCNKPQPVVKIRFFSGSPIGHTNILKQSFKSDFTPKQDLDHLRRGEPTPNIGPGN